MKLWAAYNNNTGIVEAMFQLYYEAIEYQRKNIGLTVARVSLRSLRAEKDAVLVPAEYID